MTKMPRDHRRSRVVVTTAYLMSFLFLAAAGVAVAEAPAVEQIVVAIGNGTGAPGGTADVTITLTDPTGQGTGAGVFVLFPAGTLGALTIDPAGDCVIAPRLASLDIFSALPLTNLPPGGQGFDLEIAANPFAKHCTGDPTQVCSSNGDCATAGGTCATKSCTGDPTHACNSNADCDSVGGTCATIFVPLGTGDLATCTFHIPEIAEPGTVTLTADSVLVSDASGTHLPASGSNGQVTIALATPTPTATPQSCTIDADCPPTQLCLNQVCQPAGPCTTSADCPDERPCVDGVCQQFPAPTATPTPTPQSCTIDADCPPTQLCLDEVCQPAGPCETAADCPDERPCVDGVCQQFPAPTPTASAVPTTTPTPTAQPTATATPRPTNTASPVPSATKTGVVPVPSSVDTDGCNMSQPGSGGAPSGGALLWLLVPAALLVYRRRR